MGSGTGMGYNWCLSVGEEALSEKTKRRCVCKCGKEEEKRMFSDVSEVVSPERWVCVRVCVALHLRNTHASTQPDRHVLRTVVPRSDTIWIWSSWDYLPPPSPPTYLVNSSETSPKGCPHHTHPPFWPDRAPLAYRYQKPTLTKILVT